MLNAGERPGLLGGGRRVVLTTFGSLGDLHPFLALGLGLRARGHEAIIATSESYRAKVEALGLGFRPVRPDVAVIESDPELMRRLMDLRKGTERIVCEFVMPALRDSYEDTLAASKGADLLIGHVITYATRLVAEKQRIPWASVTLSPIGFFSAHDPPVLPGAEYLRRLRFLGPTFHRPLLGLAKWSVRSWGRPWLRLRAELGLPAVREHPLFEGLFSPRLVLAMFSSWLADRQPDWPTQTVLAGFPFHVRDHEAGLPAELARFLDDGPPPIVFALGSSAVWDAGTFFQDSARAAATLGRRAVLVIGRDSRNRIDALPPEICAIDYAPYAALFPRAAAIVHQGGVGTTAQAMRAGRPMLVVPYSHDQPDNAARVTRQGIALTLPRSRYGPARAAAMIGRLLQEPRFGARAAEIGAQVQAEDGVAAACAALEPLLAAPSAGSKARAR